VLRPLLLLVIAAGLALFAGWALASRVSSADDLLIALCRDAFRAELAIAAIAIAGALLFGRPTQRLGLSPGLGRIGGRGLGWLALGTLALSHALDALRSLSGFGDQGPLAVFPELLAGARGPRLLLALGALGLTPAIAEELLCRGLLQRALVRRWGPGIGISLAALTFGALHIDPVHGTFAALLGLYLGASAHWAGNTWAPIACHATNNLAAVGLSALAWGAPYEPLSLPLGLSVAAACAWRAQRAATLRPEQPFSAGPDRTTDKGRIP
jgi:membrane protease YdiL (CAAX protease family)